MLDGPKWNDRTSTTSILHNIHSPHCPGYKVRTALRHMPESRCTSCNQPGANYSFDLQHRLHRLLVIIHSFLCPVRPPGHKPRYRPTSYTHSHIPSYSATSNRHKRREPQGALYAEVCFFRCHLKLLGKRNMPKRHTREEYALPKGQGIRL